MLVLLFLAYAIFLVTALWKVFEKAGEDGWKAIIPIWNTIVMLRIAARPWWWVFLFLIPLVGLVIAVLVCIDLAKAFGKEAGFGVGLALLGFIFIPILGFGSAEYVGPPRVL